MELAAHDSMFCVGGMKAAPMRWPATISAVLAAAVAEARDREALVDGRRRLSYGELDKLVDGVARGLSARGIRPGDRVAVSLPNSVDVVVALLSTMRTGALFVGVHPRLAPAEKTRLIADADAAMVLTSPEPGRALDVHAEVVSLDLSADGIDVLAGPTVALPVPDPLAPAAIAYTSGTTGEPKGVVHDQRHTILPAAVILYDRLGGRGERVGVQLPLTTLNVAILGPMLAFLGRGTCVCIDTHEPSALAQRIADEGIDHLSCSPATVHDLVSNPEVHHGQLEHLRLGVGGATCPEWLRSAYRERFGRDFTTGYGLSEAPTSVTQETERVPHREGASGKAMAHVSVVILDEDQRPLPAGRSGHIAVTAATNGRWAHQWQGMRGYWQRPELTYTTHDGQHLLTGDEGWLDGDGYLYVADRRSDVINRGGSKVSPIEIERVLREHAGVADCLVVGRPDDRLGEVVVAAVQSRDGAVVSSAELQAHCRSLISGYKVPEEIRVLDSLPRNPMGKVVRSAVRDLFASGSPGE